MVSLLSRQNMIMEKDKFSFSSHKQESSFFVEDHRFFLCSHTIELFKRYRDIIWWVYCTLAMIGSLLLQFI